MFLYLVYCSYLLFSKVILLNLFLIQQPQSQKQQKSRPQQQQQTPPKQPITLQRAASAAARQLGVTSQSQEIQAAPAATMVRRLTTSKSAPVASTKPLPPNAANLSEETKTSTANLVAEEAPAPANNANAPIHETDASLLPETETDDMVIDGDDAATEDMAEHILL
jgi:cytoskeletal protein RodZ